MSAGGGRTRPRVVDATGEMLDNGDLENWSEGRPEASMGVAVARRELRHFRSLVQKAPAAGDPSEGGPS